jgi:tetratricopeptide (TPR) repeat protein
MGDLGGELFAYQNAIGNTISLGNLAEAEKMLAHGRELYEQLEDPGAAGELYLSAANYFEFAKGQLDEALSGRRALLAQATESGSEFEFAVHGFFLGLILIELAEFDEAAVVLTDAIASADKVDRLRDFIRSLMAIVLTGQGKAERAREMLEQAEVILSERPRAWAEMVQRGSEANVLAAEGRWEQAFRTFEQAAADISEVGFRTTHATTLRDWAEAHLARGEPGDTEQATELLGEALTEYEEMGATGWVERVQARLDELEK